MIKTISQDTKITVKNQSGQTLVEFILILMGIVIISFSFMSIINGNISNRWTSIANIILDDPNQTLEIQ